MKIDKRLALISPKWYKRIIKTKSYRELLKPVNLDGFKQLDLSQYGSCVVGESHDFNGNYSTQEQKKSEVILIGCPRCTSFAQQIYIESPDRRSGKLFQEIISSYLDHISIDHGVKL